MPEGDGRLEIQDSKSEREVPVHIWHQAQRASREEAEEVVLQDVEVETTGSAIHRNVQDKADRPA